MREKTAGFWIRAGSGVAVLALIGALGAGCSKARSAVFSEGEMLGEAVGGDAPAMVGAAGGFGGIGGFAGGPRQAYGRRAAGVALADAPTAPAEEAPPPPEAAPEPPVPGGGAPTPPVAIQPDAAARLVIYTAKLGVLVGNVEEAMTDLLARIKTWDGYVQSSDLQTVTFRLPAQNFNRAMDEIAAMGVVTNKQINAQDVTSQYRDLQLRLEVAETSRKRMLAILEKADKTTDVIEIEREVRRLTEEIEGLKAQVRTMADQIAYSTITVSLTAKAASPLAQPRPRKHTSYFAWINQIGAEHVINTFSR